MSLYNEASLVMVPSAYKDQKVYSVKPFDGSGDLDFSRGSDIEATRVNANGYIEKAQVNLLLQSNSFDTTWTTSNITLTSGQAGYGGSNDAWKVTPNAVNNSHYVSQNISISGVYSWSVYAKADGYNYIFLYNGGVNRGQYFNLSNGTLGASYLGGGIDASIESVGGGWYRCTFVFNVSAAGSTNIFVTETDSAFIFTGNGTSGVLVQDAQVNYGLVAQTYQETTTAAVVSGITDNMPRLNYDPANPTCPSLLLEPSRQNLIPQSEYFADASWVQTRMTTASTSETSPEGVQNVYLLSNTTDTGNHTTVYNLGSLTNPSIALSFFVKKKDNDFVQIGMYNSSTNWNAAKFNIETGTALDVAFAGNHSVPTNASVVSYGNGWYRISAIFASSVTSATEQVYITATPTSAPPTGAFGLGGGWTGATTENVWVYGAQAENNASYPSSYIPSYGSSATRTADACSKTGISSLIGQTEGTLFVDFVGSTEFQHRFSVAAAGSNNNWIFFSMPENASGNGRVYIRTNSITHLDSNAGLTGAFVSGQRYKVAFAYKSGDWAIYINGVLKSSGSQTFTAPATMDGLYPSGTGPSSGAQVQLTESKFNQTLLFKTRLPNSDLATLTSL